MAKIAEQIYDKTKNAEMVSFLGFYTYIGEEQVLWKSQKGSRHVEHIGLRSS